MENTLQQETEKIKAIMDVLGISEDKQVDHIERLSNLIWSKVFQRIAEKNPEAVDLKAEEIEDYAKETLNPEEIRQIISEEANALTTEYFTAIMQGSDEETFNKIQAILES